MVWCLQPEGSFAVGAHESVSRATPPLLKLVTQHNLRCSRNSCDSIRLLRVLFFFQTWLCARGFRVLYYVDFASEAFMVLQQGTSNTLNFINRHGASAAFGGASVAASALSGQSSCGRRKAAPGQVRENHRAQRVWRTRASTGVSGKQKRLRGHAQSRRRRKRPDEGENEPAEYTSLEILQPEPPRPPRK